MIDAKGIEGDEAYIRKLLKEVPEECDAIGLDVKCYWVSEEHVERLRAWEGRKVADGKKIQDFGFLHPDVSQRHGGLD